MRNMTKRRRALINSYDKSSLPEEYQEVAWLRGTGSQYCTLPYGLGYHDGHFFGIIGNVEALDASRYSELWITSSDGIPSQALYYHRWGATLQYGDISVGVYPDWQSMGYDVLSYAFEMNSNNIIINDNITIPQYPQNSGGSSTYIGAGLGQNNSLVVHNNNVTIKSIKITKDDVIIYELIPCYRKTDNKAGFFYWIDYEQGTSGFLTNNAAGNDFLIGPIV